MDSNWKIIFWFAVLLLVPGGQAACVPKAGCQAVAWYVMARNEQLSMVYTRFQVNLSQLQEFTTIKNENSIEAGATILIPFTCRCLDEALGTRFTFPFPSNTSTTAEISQEYYHNLTNTASIAAVNPTGGTVYPGQPISIPVQCYCGDPKNPTYGLFATYPVQPQDNASAIAAKFNITTENLTAYNPSPLNLSNNNILFVPAKFANGTVPAFSDTGDNEKSNKTAVVVGASVGAVAALFVALAALWFCVYRSRDGKRVQYEQSDLGSGIAFSSKEDPSLPAGLSVDKSVEFSYDELAAATDNFSLANKIGQGGYGAVYYGEIRDQKLAIKMMNLQATREFMSELKVLTHVHHTNLVQLIGYCTGDYLFLVYEYVDNGTMSHHLRGSGVAPLSWARRVQIALDAARGLEYIHEHTKPTYIHRDVKSPNILIDKSFRAKVADFGLTKLTESNAGGSASMTQPSRLVGTFGYMPPEYARFGDVSPKIDVYSFGVVLYELVSAKDAIVRGTNGDNVDILPKGLVTLFDAALKGPNPMEDLKGLVDPALGANYPFDSVWKLSKLAEACTHETPENRPSMRTVVVALMTLCSTTQELEFSDAQLGPLISGR